MCPAHPEVLLLPTRSNAAVRACMGAWESHGKTYLERGGKEEKDTWKVEGSVSQSSSHKINAQLLFVLHEIPKRWELREPSGDCE